MRSFDREVGPTMVPRVPHAPGRTDRSGIAESGVGRTVQALRPFLRDFRGLRCGARRAGKMYGSWKLR